MPSDAYRSENPGFEQAVLNQFSVEDTVKAVTVDNVEVNDDTILDGSYKLQRPFVLVTKEDTELSETAQKFFDFATSADAYDIISEAGAVPNRA